MRISFLPFVTLVLVSHLAVAREPVSSAWRYQKGVSSSQSAGSQRASAVRSPTGAVRKVKSGEAVFSEASAGKIGPAWQQAPLLLPKQPSEPDLTE